jgi:hypothetical protein
MLTVDKLSLQTGDNDHMNGTIKCRRNKLKLLYINILDYHIYSYILCITYVYILSVYFLNLYPQIYCVWGAIIQVAAFLLRL